MFNFGDNVRDVATGYIGKVTGRAEYDKRETLYLIESVDRTGRPVECWLPAGRMETISE